MSAGVGDDAQPGVPASALEPRGLVGTCPSTVPKTPEGQIQGGAPCRALRWSWPLRDGSSCSALLYPASRAAGPGCSRLPAALPLGPGASGCPLRRAGDGALPGDALQPAWCRRWLRRCLYSLPWARTHGSALQELPSLSPSCSCPRARDPLQGSCVPLRGARRLQAS